MTDYNILEERIRALEKKYNDMYRSRAGYSAQPGKNVLGQDTLVQGNLVISGILTADTFSVSEMGAHDHQSDAQGTKLDHGLAISGLGDDDHTQYFNQSRLYEESSADVSGTSVAKVLKCTTAGGLKLKTLELTSDLTVSTVLKVEQSAGRVGINCTPDSQFALDVAGNIRAQGWIVGKHALQLPDARMICHFDGPQPYESNYFGDPTGHMGQKATVVGGVNYRPGYFGKGVEVAEAGTNLITNPSFETNVSGWTPGGSNTVAQSSETAKYGEYSAKCTYQDNAVFLYQTITLTAVDHIFGVHIYIPSGYDGTRILINFNNFTGSSGTIITDADMNIRDEWQFVTVDCTPDSGDLTGLLRIYSGTSDVPTVGKFIYVDAAICVASSYVVPYFDGTMNGCSWSGTEHASTSIRAQSVLSYSVDISTEITISFWAKLSHLISEDTGYRRFIEWANGEDDRFSILVYYGQNKLYIVRKCGGASAYAIPASTTELDIDNFHHIVATYDGEFTKLYIDSTLVATGNSDTAEYSNKPNTIYIGTNHATYQPFSGWIDDLAIFDRALSADEIRAIYESNAPVFAETSAWSWSTPDGGSWMDEDGINLKAFALSASSPGSQTIDFVTAEKDYIGGLMGVYTSSEYEIILQAYGGPGSIAHDGIITLKTSMNAAAPYSDTMLMINPSYGVVIVGGGSAAGNLRVNGYVGVKDGMTAPSAVTGLALIYVDSADGDLKIRFSDGTTKTIVVDT